MENNKMIEPALLTHESLKQIEKNGDGKNLHQYLAAGVVGLTTLQCGICSGWTSPVLPYLTSKDSFISLTEDQTSWIGSLLGLGAGLSVLLVGSIADTIGRRRSIMGFALLFLVSWILLIFSSNLWCIYLARFLAGLGLGVNSMLAIIYVGEIAEPSIRGTLASIVGVLMTTGLLVAYIAGTVLSYTGFAILGVVLMILFIILSPFVVESPVWLVQKNRIAEAKRSLRRLRGKYYNVDGEVALLLSNAKNETFKKGGIRDLIATKAGRHSALIGVGLLFFQQSTGISVMSFYTVTVLQMAESTIDPFAATVVKGVVACVMELVSSTLVDKAGRRPLLIISATGSAISLGTLGLYFYLKNSGTDATSLGWIPLASLVVWTVSYSIGFGTMIWVICGEIFSPELKGVGTSITGFMNWSFSFLVVKLFPIATSTMGESVVFGGFTIVTLFAILFFIYCIPETKGKTLQEIQDILHS